jgi:hypothetical protein
MTGSNTETPSGMQSNAPADTQRVFNVYIIGDSHALPYRNQLFREDWTGQWVLARSRYVSGLTAHDLFDEGTGEFHPELVRFLEYEGLVRNGRATHLSRDDVDFAIAKASGQSVTPPLILLTVGDIDIRGAIMPLLKDSHDFVPPVETALPLLDKPLLPWDVLDKAMTLRIRPLIAGLRQLQESGFNRLYVQAVVPPTQDEARVVELHGYACPVSVRTKLVAAFNAKLRVECERIGVKVIGDWGPLTVDGLRRPELEFDGVHLPPSAARGFVNELLEDAINCQWFAVNHVRYELFYRMACGLEPFDRNSAGTTLN